MSRKKVDAAEDIWVGWPYAASSITSATGSRWPSLGTVYDCCLLCMHVGVEQFADLVRSVASYSTRDTRQFVTMIQCVYLPRLQAINRRVYGIITSSNVLPPPLLAIVYEYSPYVEPPSYRTSIRDIPGMIPLAETAIMAHGVTRAVDLFACALTSSIGYQMFVSQIVSSSASLLTVSTRTDALTPLVKTFPPRLLLAARIKHLLNLVIDYGHGYMDDGSPLSALFGITTDATQTSSTPIRSVVGGGASTGAASSIAALLVAPIQGRSAGGTGTTATTTATASTSGSSSSSSSIAEEEVGDGSDASVPIFGSSSSSSSSSSDIKLLDSFFAAAKTSSSSSSSSSSATPAGETKVTAAATAASNLADDTASLALALDRLRMRPGIKSRISSSSVDLVKVVALPSPVALQRVIEQLQILLQSYNIDTSLSTAPLPTSLASSSSSSSSSAPSIASGINSGMLSRLTGPMSLLGTVRPSSQGDYPSLVAKATKQLARAIWYHNLSSSSSSSSAGAGSKKKGAKKVSKPRVITSVDIGRLLSPVPFINVANGDPRRRLVNAIIYCIDWTNALPRVLLVRDRQTGKWRFPNVHNRKKTTSDSKSMSDDTNTSNDSNNNNNDDESNDHENVLSMVRAVTGLSNGIIEGHVHVKEQFKSRSSSNEWLQTYIVRVHYDPQPDWLVMDHQRKQDEAKAVAAAGPDAATPKFTAGGRGRVMLTATRKKAVAAIDDHDDDHEANDDEDNIHTTSAAVGAAGVGAKKAAGSSASSSAISRRALVGKITSSLLSVSSTTSDSTPFTCSACTFDNLTGGRKCSVCHTPRPAAPAPVVVAAPSSPTATPPSTTASLAVPSSTTATASASTSGAAARFEAEWLASQSERAAIATRAPPVMPPVGLPPEVAAALLAAQMKNPPKPRSSSTERLPSSSSSSSSSTSSLGPGISSFGEHKATPASLLPSSASAATTILTPAKITSLSGARTAVPLSSATPFLPPVVNYNDAQLDSLAAAINSCIANGGGLLDTSRLVTRAAVTMTPAQRITAQRIRNDALVARKNSRISDRMEAQHQQVKDALETKQLQDIEQGWGEFVSVATQRTCQWILCTEVLPREAVNRSSISAASVSSLQVKYIDNGGIISIPRQGILGSTSRMRTLLDHSPKLWWRTHMLAYHRACDHRLIPVIEAITKNARISPVMAASKAASKLQTAASIRERRTRLIVSSLPAGEVAAILATYDPPLPHIDRTTTSTSGSSATAAATASSSVAVPADQRDMAAELRRQKKSALAAIALQRPITTVTTATTAPSPVRLPSRDDIKDAAAIQRISVPITTSTSLLLAAQATATQATMDRAHEIPPPLPVLRAPAAAAAVPSRSDDDDTKHGDAKDDDSTSDTCNSSGTTAVDDDDDSSDDESNWRAPPVRAADHITASDQLDALSAADRSLANRLQVPIHRNIWQYLIARHAGIPPPAKDADGDDDDNNDGRGDGDGNNNDDDDQLQEVPGRIIRSFTTTGGTGSGSVLPTRSSINVTARRAR